MQAEEGRIMSAVEVPMMMQSRSAGSIFPCSRAFRAAMVARS